VADFCHNFIDGVSIATSYSLGLTAGISTTIAILFHELPHELGDFGVLMKKKFAMSQILGTQVLTSLGALLGGIICLQF